MDDITQFIEGDGLNQILKLPLTILNKTTKGNILEKYCILRICYFAFHSYQESWSFTYFSSDLKPNHLAISFRITNYLMFRVRSHTIGDCLLDYFRNQNIEEQCGSDTYCGTLFILNTDNFKGLDMIFMSAQTKKIFLFQFALNITTHTSSDVELYKFLDGEISFDKS